MTRAAIAGHWQCLGCDEHGTTTATESGADRKHQKATNHSTIQGTDPEVLARVRTYVVELETTLAAARNALAACREVREARAVEA